MGMHPCSGSTPGTLLLPRPVGGFRLLTVVLCYLRLAQVSVCLVGPQGFIRGGEGAFVKDERSDFLFGLVVDGKVDAGTVLHE